LKAEQLKKLSTLTSVGLAAVQSQMAQVRRREKALHDQLSDLRANQYKATMQGGAAQRAGADVRWQQWVDGRIGEINMELARTLAKKERLRDQLRIAFGKDQAMQKLTRKAVIAAQETRQKRF